MLYYLTGLTENTMRSYEKNPDDENRLFYVGATTNKRKFTYNRTKKIRERIHTMTNSEHI